MENDSLTIRLHHRGDFSKTTYSGGSFETIDADPDLFSYSVLMEFVKELKYEEIAGIYVSNSKNSGWKLVTDDKTVGEYMKGKSELDFYIDSNVDQSIPPMKQMQPHVIVRPRRSPVKGKEKIAEKRTFVTLKNINAEKTRKLRDMKDEKERRKNTRKMLQFSIGSKDAVQDKVLESEEEIRTENDGLLGLEEALKTYETPNRDEEITKDVKGGEIIAKDVEGAGCNEYEMNRNKNVEKNKAYLAELGIGQSKSASLCDQKNKDKSKAANDDTSESEYIPKNDGAEQASDDAADEIVTSKVCFLPCSFASILNYILPLFVIKTNMLFRKKKKG